FCSNSRFGYPATTAVIRAPSSADKRTERRSTPEVASPPETWLTRYIRNNPGAQEVFFRVLGLMGYGSAKQYAGRRAFIMYRDLCIPRADDEQAFWKDEMSFPPTFQSWFTITNLHVWLLTVRLRALPPPHGTHYVQALIDHFFLDIEDRIRAVLQPFEPGRLTPANLGFPYTSRTDFYTVANADKISPSPVMKIFKEQWAGMGMSFDLGLVRSDPELAAAVWRNMLGARGARGIVYPEDGSEQPYFRRTVNLAGGEMEKFDRVEKAGLAEEEARDDGSGVHDFAPADAYKYVAYPELMETMVEYMRAEVDRLAKIPDHVFIGAGKIGTESDGMDEMVFGAIRRVGSSSSAPPSV
ncbi:uncharacterized protein BXZ73DRAFT_80965, partial [Epithele typhae]|uniref:uncharacterized protein n=1 Tax=Epithele typhae TaxID=378194 RepID=UPI002008B801